MKKNFADGAPWNEIARQFLGEDFFENMVTVSTTAKSGGPNADVYHGNDEVIVVVDLPGIEDINSLNVQVEEDTLLLKGSCLNPYQAYEVSHTERIKGTFQKKIPLGMVVNPKYTSARYRKGILEIRFPKKKQKSAHRLQIHSID